MTNGENPVTLRGEQARNQLIAAAIAQFGEFGLAATTRDIAAAAGQNIAAITYYFGSKEDLYLASARWIAEFISSHFRPHLESAERLLSQPTPDKPAMRQLIANASRELIRLTTLDDTLNLSKFISREQLAPGAAWALIHEAALAPLHLCLTRLIAAVTGRDANQTTLILHTHALIGQILAFRLGRETFLLRVGWQQFDDDKAAQIYQVVTDHIDWILEGLTATRSREQ